MKSPMKKRRTTAEEILTRRGTNTRKSIIRRTEEPILENLFSKVLEEKMGIKKKKY